MVVYRPKRRSGKTDRAKAVRAVPSTDGLFSSEERALCAKNWKNGETPAAIYMREKKILTDLVYTFIYSQYYKVEEFPSARSILFKQYSRAKTRRGDRRVIFCVGVEEEGEAANFGGHRVWKNREGGKARLTFQQRVTGGTETFCKRHLGAGDGGGRWVGCVCGWEAEEEGGVW